MIAFIVPNAKLPYPLAHYQVSVDEVERRTGIDFFPALEDSLEKFLESSVTPWDFYKRKTVKQAAIKSTPTTASRCQATTQKGSRCKRKSSASSGYCWQHGG